MSPSPDAPVIEVVDLVRKFGDRAVINDISFNVRRGETLVIMGGSGCGKSTLLRQVIGLPRALALDPELLASEEPTSGLDPIMTAVVHQLTLKLTQGEHMTAVVVTHDMTSAFRIATRMIMLGHGSIVAQGTPDEIRNSENPEVQQFINGQADGPIPLNLSQDEHEHHQHVKP